MKRIEWLGLAACGLVALAAFDCGSTPACDVDGGCADAAPPPVPPVSGGGCDSSKTPAQGGCAVDDTDGFFVAPTGSDTATGAKASPFKTIGRGILAAAGNASKPNVYICHGTYAENLVIQTAPAGVALHGGFDCASWAQMSLPTEVAPAYVPGGAQQYVLDVVGAAALVESMTLTAPDATDPGASSIACFVSGSPGMTFRRAAVTSGRGGDGVSPIASAPAAANSDGNPAPASGTQVAPAKSCSCTSDTTTGGSGGVGPPNTVASTSGLPVIPSDPTAGAAGSGGTCTGGKGADGLAGSVGASASTTGVLSAAGWVPRAGASGGGGGTAQGGGGGGYLVAGGPPNAGGSGACGGCGGKGGAGAPGGGASIAIAVVNSTLRVQASTVHSGAGGNGADGAAGQGGQPGGAGGAATAVSAPSCNGGGGGTGGAGGPGGGGAGGISVAVATVQTTPDIDQFSTVLAGTLGKGGHDGSQQAVKAVDGVAQPIQAF